MYTNTSNLCVSFLSLFFLPFPCVHIWGTCLFSCVWLYTCVCAHRYLILVSGIFLDSSTLFSETGSLDQTQSLPVWLVLLDSLLWGSSIFFPRLEFQVGFHTPPGIFHGFWGSGPLCIQLSNCLAPSRVLHALLIPAAPWLGHVHLRILWSARPLK